MLLKCVEFSVNFDCVAPENIHTPHHRGNWKFQRGGGQKSRKFLRGGVKLTSRWFSLIQYRPTAVAVTKSLLTDFGGTF